MNDLAQRFGENSMLRPRDLRPSVEGMEVTCLLNPGAFRFQDKTCLLVRVGERPAQVPGKTSFPILSPEGRLVAGQISRGLDQAGNTSSAVSLAARSSEAREPC